MSSESAILPLSSLFHSASTSSFSGVSFASSAYNVDFIGFGEMEALDFDDDNMQLEEEDDDADNIMMNEEDDMAIDELPLSALHPHIAAEGQFRAGTPTPIHTSPPTEMIVPPPMTHSLSTSSSSSSASTSHSDDNNDSSSTSSTPVHPLSALSLSETANPAGVAMDDGNNVTLTPSATTTLDVDPLIIQTTQPNNLQAVIMNYFDVPNVLWTYIPISPQGVEIPDEPQPQTSETPQEIVTEDLDHEFLDVRRRNFWNSWVRYRCEKQQGFSATNISTEWADLVTFLMDTRPEEITGQDFDNGLDMQGLSWGEGGLPPKDDFREKRVKDYGSLIVKPPPPPPAQNPAHDPTRIHTFYKFRYTNLNYHCSVHHFQLRYLLSAPTKNDLYYIHENSLRHWDPLNRSSHEIYNFKNSRAIPWKGWTPSTLSCAHGVAAVGGYNGEYGILPLTSSSSLASRRLGTIADSTFITNHVDVIRTRAGAVTAVWSNNDFKIRQQDVETGKFVVEHTLGWAVNATATSPDKMIRAAVGDAREVVLMDASRGGVIKALTGHHHWSFAVDWRNDGYTFITGNQDMSARLWDARYMNESFLTLPAKMGAIRSVHFSSDGKYLAIAEPADYLHIYDASTGLYEEKQTIEFFGEIAGVTFDPMGNSLFVGNADDLVGGIYEFDRVRRRECDDRMYQSWEDILL